MKGKWSSFTCDDYALEDLGRPAIFLIPTKKLRKSRKVEKELHKFLVRSFGAYTSSTIPSFGFWRNSKKATICDECRQYEVSFPGKERISLLLKKLAEIALVLKEECIYVKAGQYSALVYPKRKEGRKCQD